jgi:hypothetical protein
MVRRAIPLGYNQEHTLGGIKPFACASVFKEGKEGRVLNAGLRYAGCRGRAEESTVDRGDMSPWDIVWLRRPCAREAARGELGIARGGEEGGDVTTDRLGRVMGDSLGGDVGDCVGWTGLAANGSSSRSWRGERVAPGGRVQFNAAVVLVDQV